MSDEGDHVVDETLARFPDRRFLWLWNAFLALLGVIVLASLDLDGGDTNPVVLPLVWVAFGVALVGFAWFQIRLGRLWLKAWTAPWSFQRAMMRLSFGPPRGAERRPSGWLAYGLFVAGYVGVIAVGLRTFVTTF